MATVLGVEAGVYKVNGDRFQVLPGGQVLRLRGDLGEAVLATIPEAPSQLKELVASGVMLETPQSLKEQTIFKEELEEILEDVPPGGGQQTAAILEAKPAIKARLEQERSAARFQLEQFKVNGGFDLARALRSGVDESTLKTAGFKQSDIDEALRNNETFAKQIEAGTQEIAAERAEITQPVERTIEEETFAQPDDTVELSTGEFVSLDVFSSLTSNEQDILRRVGVEEFNTLQEEFAAVQAPPLEVPEEFITEEGIDVVGAFEAELATFEDIEASFGTGVAEQVVGAVEERREAAARQELSFEAFTPVNVSSGREVLRNAFPTTGDLLSNPNTQFIGASRYVTTVRVGTTDLRAIYRIEDGTPKFVRTTTPLREDELSKPVFTGEGPSPTEQFDKLKEIGAIPEDAVFGGVTSDGIVLYRETTDGPSLTVGNIRVELGNSQQAKESLIRGLRETFTLPEGATEVLQDAFVVGSVGAGADVLRQASVVGGMTPIIAAAWVSSRLGPLAYEQALERAAGVSTTREYFNVTQELPSSLPLTPPSVDAGLQPLTPPFIPTKVTELVPPSIPVGGETLVPPSVQDPLVGIPGERQGAFVLQAEGISTLAPDATPSPGQTVVTREQLVSQLEDRWDVELEQAQERIALAELRDITPEASTPELERAKALVRQVQQDPGLKGRVTGTAVDIVERTSRPSTLDEIFQRALITNTATRRTSVTSRPIIIPVQPTPFEIPEFLPRTAPVIETVTGTETIPVTVTDPKTDPITDPITDPVVVTDPVTITDPLIDTPVDTPAIPATKTITRTKTARKRLAGLPLPRPKPDEKKEPKKITRRCWSIRRESQDFVLVINETVNGEVTTIPVDAFRTLDQARRAGARVGLKECPRTPKFPRGGGFTL